MAKTLVIIRDLQQVPTLPIAINFTTVRYIDIYVVKIKILVALFSAKVHPSSTIRQVRVRLNIEVHLLLTCDKLPMLCEMRTMVARLLYVLPWPSIQSIAIPTERPGNASDL